MAGASTPASGGRTAAGRSKKGTLATGAAKEATPATASEYEASGSRVRVGTIMPGCPARHTASGAVRTEARTTRVTVLVGVTASAKRTAGGLEACASTASAGDK